MTNWIEISPLEMSPASDCLQSFLNEKKVSNKFELRTCRLEDFISTLADVQKQWSYIRVHESFQNIIINDDSAQTIPQMVFGVADTLIKQENKFWPRCMAFEGMQTYLSKKMRKMAIDGTVLVLGSSNEAKAVIGALAKAGFQKITFVSKDENPEMLEKINQKFFSIVFKSIALDSLTSLRPEHSFILNALTPEEFADFGNELSYLNFLRTGAVWLDINPKSKSEVLSAEIQSFNIQYIGPDLFRAYLDMAWVKNAFLDLNVKDSTLIDWADEFSHHLKSLSDW